MSSNQLPARPVVEHLLDVSRDKFEAALSNKPVGFDAWKVAVLAEFRRVPDLAKAATEARDTVIECLAVCASVGLMPGRAYDQFYLIPRWSGKAQRTECTFIVGYKGLIELAMRHDRVHSVEAFLVYEGEDFAWSPSTGELRHSTSFGIDKSDAKIVGAYSVVRLTTPNGLHVEERPLYWAMGRAEIEAVMRRSSAYQQALSASKKYGREPIGPWFSDFGKMARKTVIRSHFNGGAIPRRLELVEMMARETEGDTIQVEAEPAMKRGTATLRTALGLDPEPETNAEAVRRFDLAEEAVAWIEQAPAAEVEARAIELVQGWTGADFEMVKSAIDYKLASR